MNEKQKLVVIGNGMAGARTVEEILSRGGGEQFEITVFGDEPYGNYNRILLSNVLNGSQDAADIFLNPLDWYTENSVKLHAPARVTQIDRARKEVYSDDDDRVSSGCFVDAHSHYSWRKHIAYNSRYQQLRGCLWES